MEKAEDISPARGWMRMLMVLGGRKVRQTTICVNERKEVGMGMECVDTVID